MLPIELTTSDLSFVAIVEIASFAKLPDVIIWGSRCFVQRPRDFTGRLGPAGTPLFVEGFAVTSLTVSPGLPREELPPVDLSARETIGGTPVGEHLEILPNGQQKDYVVLTEEERAKGFVRPVRRSYKHEKCGGVTTMDLPIAQTYARMPSFYSGTFCVTCAGHFPVGAAGEFVWDGTSQKVGT